MGSPASSELSDAAPAEAASGVDLDQLRDILHGTPGRPGLIDALPRLQRSHRKELIRVERWTTGDLARHPEPRSLIRSRRKPGNLDEHGRLRRVFDQRRVLTEDIHENRVVLHAVQEVRAQLAIVADDGEAEAFDLLRELDGAIASAPFLQELSTLRSLPRTPTPTLQSDPIYRSVFLAWLSLPRVER
jgi:Domain of unknown function (DUF2357)